MAPSIRRWLVTGLLAAALAPRASAAEKVADGLAGRRAALDKQYAAELAELARWCDDRQLAEQANLVRHWLPPREPGELLVFVVPDDAGASEPAADADQDQIEWQQRFTALRQARARALVELAAQAAQGERWSLAPLWLTEALREDPDQARARKALGYEKHGGRWCTANTRRMLAAGKIWQDEFGWLDATDLKRYRQGERRWQKQWIDAAEETLRRRVIANGWKIETDHYLVTTNRSQQEGVALALRLERFHEVWRQLFVEYYATAAEMRGALEGRAPLDTHSKPHQVVYYNTRDEYNAALQSAQPNIGITLGIYFDTRRRAYFFAGDDQHEGTIYHEAAHQLFQETRKVKGHVGQDANFWIVEGIAAYLESLTEHEGYFTVGGLEAGRVPAARQRLLADNFYVPLATLTQMGTHDVQRDPNIAKLYSQAAGQATFLMHYDEGRFRDALVRYLVAIYTGKDGPDTLARLTGVGFETLDRQYREFLQ